MTKDVQSKIELLRREVEKHRIAYHTHDNPTISDESYDALMQELILLEQKYPQYNDPRSPSNRVGGVVLDQFKKVTHSMLQWSYDNVFNFEELAAWERRNQNYLKKETGQEAVFSYFAELKIDGLKLILTYKNGSLLQAATRGDGEVGEDITNNVFTINSIPKYLSENTDITVIGECWLAKSEFEKINNLRKKEGQEEYKNPRNLAAGTLRQLDSSLVRERDLQFFAYDTDHELNQDKENEHLTKLGFMVNNQSRLCKNLSEVEEYYKKWNTDAKDKEEYGIDGVVVKINEKKYEQQLGYTAKSPRGGIAYKLKSKEAVTQLLSVTYQVGRTGSVTPVAELAPVILDGTTVKRATLHNFDEIERLGVQVGDYVQIRKAGDIIPQVFGVMTSIRNGTEKKILEIKTCPECESNLYRDTENEGVKLQCKNVTCPAKNISRLIYFASKKCMDIENLGEETVKQLFEIGLVVHASDFYTLTYEDLIALEGFKDKSVTNLLESIQKSKTQKLERFITALGIPNVGEETAIDLAKRFISFERFWNSGETELLSIYGLGQKTVDAIMEFKQKDVHKKEVATLLEYIDVRDYVESKVSQRLSDMRFVITGSFDTNSREEIQKIIKDNGGVVQNDVNQKTSYLILGTDPGSKLAKAQKLSIAIISFDEFRKLLQ